MAEALKIKRGDTHTPVRSQLEDEDGPALLLGAVILFKMKQVNGAKTVTGTATAVAPAAVDPDPDAGWVTYSWRLDGTDTNVAGVFRQEWEVTFADGSVETFPSDGWNDIVIRDDI